MTSAIENLAVNLALEEWRHWLEGAKQPFIVRTDHKNLAYIQTAKRLVSWQARWSSFFGRFDFTLTYCPGSRNIKPDGLSQLFTTKASSKPETILSSSSIIASVTWHPIQVPDPIIVCLSLTLSILMSSSGPIQPDSPVTLELIELSPSSASASGGPQWTKTPRILLLPAQSVPGTRLPLNRYLDCFTPYLYLLTLGHTLPWILLLVSLLQMVTQSFSQSLTVNFIPLPKLPSSRETADLLVNHVFRLHGIPADIVSDRGPQFISEVWKAFCAALDCTVSLSSGFHPQTNSQTEWVNQE